MSEIFQAVILGIVQGFTEFLPISSSGHLVVLPKLFGWNGVVDSLSFDVALHLGSTVAVVGFFLKDWQKLFANFFKIIINNPSRVISDQNTRLLLMLFLGSLPVALVGFSFKDFFETSARNMLLTALMLITFGLILWFADTKNKQEKKMENLKFFDALLIGVAQALSLIPGVSRSGITITAARFLGTERQDAVRFSFLLSTPAILGAGIFTLKDLLSDGTNGGSLIFSIGFVFSLIASLLAIKLLLFMAKKADFTPFVIYRIAFGVFLLFWSLFII